MDYGYYNRHNRNARIIGELLPALAGVESIDDRGFRPAFFNNKNWWL